MILHVQIMPKNVTVRGNDSINEQNSVCPFPLKIFLWLTPDVKVIFNTAVMNDLNKKQVLHTDHTMQVITAKILGLFYFSDQSIF